MLRHLEAWAQFSQCGLRFHTLASCHGPLCVHWAMMKAALPDLGFGV